MAVLSLYLLRGNAAIKFRLEFVIPPFCSTVQVPCDLHKDFVY